MTNQHPLIGKWENKGLGIVYSIIQGGIDESFNFKTFKNGAEEVTFKVILSASNSDWPKIFLIASGNEQLLDSELLILENDPYQFYILVPSSGETLSYQKIYFAKLPE